MKELPDSAERARAEDGARLDHDIRTLVSGIIGLSSVLQDTDLSVEQREVVDHIRASSDTLFALLTDVLGALRNEPPIAAASGARPIDSARPATQRQDRTAAIAPLASAKTVLVVDDDAVNQKVAVFMLAKRGFRADAVDGGRDAIEAALRFPYAAILMDCHLPGFDGFQAAAELRARESQGRRTPIIATTADTHPLVRDRCLESGMDDYLAKPLLGPALDATLKKWCGSATETPQSVPWEETPPKTARSGGAEGEPDSQERVSSLPPPSVLDRAVLARLRALERNGSTDLLAEVTTIYLTDAKTRLARLREATARGDAAAVAQIAHALKGSSAQLGARGVEAVASRLETLGRCGGVAEAEALIPRVEAELERARMAIETELAAPVST